MTEQGSGMKTEKTAIVGASPVIRMLPKIMVAAMGQSDKTRSFARKRNPFPGLAKKSGYYLDEKIGN
ncbi:hypothetical protein GF359_00355 [candidate division WOR-3 bacterium]|uniref:Uncharacterized protein n=1 Tax=candidate division WOR-3 bacterium TaxID=2052148 RepID=A0A9D5QBM9_UNCW3|nr:hypothetical protein [candidate division WOR-3 bacterium]MBD3363644.1 hypothetical protein [candidate division WOR-3 bacterium]